MRATVDPLLAGARLDTALAKLAGVARTRAAAAIRAGLVLRNGLPAKGSETVAEGDRIDYEIEPPPALNARPEAIPLDIVYEDAELLVVNKPPGMVTHPAHGAYSGTLVNALLAHVGTLPVGTGEEAPLRPGLVHRLDRDTSGLLVVAKTPRALELLGRAMQHRKITRRYVGIAVGTVTPPAGTVAGPIGRDQRNRQKMAVREGGKPAVTHYRTLEALRGATELAFELETGRTHQIRVHMAALGFPLLNDPVYGHADKRVALPGQALHAGSLSFRHPVTGEELTFAVDPPVEYAAARELFRG
ncbi:MAG TPA: RluA family pseudouridine synthase [Candidatus Dormibacteraeota bacterium]|nr:RluA family pseudouridine synthase [Candidatus Dormibacteraeota bacterium]